MRSIARLTGCDKETVAKILCEGGEFCSIYQHHVLRNLPSRRVEADEIWSFIGARPGHSKNPAYGDVYTFTGMCSDSKLMIWWLVGYRRTDGRSMRPR
jgi:hypothetical protein